MKKQVNSKTETIEVPIEIASEVKLFVNLQLTNDSWKVNDNLLHRGF